MAYTVKKIAKLSGVSVRTLHWYDEVGLLKPAYHGANGYRFYEEKQLLILQQILFFRELGFELKQIGKILGRGDFDQIVALRSHKRVLERNLERTEKLIQTIVNTIKHLEGNRKMKEHEFYKGFDKEKQKEHEKYLIDRFGDKVKKHFTECEKNVKNWSKADWEKNAKESKELCQALAELMRKDFSTGSKEVQILIRKHYEVLKRFWTPDRESYIGHGQLIADSELGKYYAAFHPQMPTFIAEAIQIFAEKELA